MKHEPFLYKWTELSTGKWYVGSRTAKRCHTEDGYLCSSKIVKPLIIANPSDWTREILCMGEAEYICDLEVHYLISLDAMRDPMSYNKSNGRKNFMGGPQSQETKAKRSATMKGRKCAPRSQEHQAKLTAAAKGRTAPNKGKTHSPEAKAKMSAANKGRPKSPETRAKVSAVHKGKTVSQETKDKMSASRKGMKYNTTKGKT